MCKELAREALTKPVSLQELILQNQTISPCNALPADMSKLLQELVVAHPKRVIYQLFWLMNTIFV